MARICLSHVLVSAVVLLGGCAKKEAMVVVGSESKGAPAESKGSATGGERKGGGGGRGGRGGGAGQRQPVEATPIVRRDLSATLPVVGSLAANEFATIRPEMNGLIRSIHFEEGQGVKKGDLLVKIEDSELQAQVAQSRARHDLAKQNLVRAENLRQTQSNTQADVDRTRSEFSAAEADVKLLEVRLARTEVRAPFDGIVEGRTLSPGDYVNTQAVLTTISDLKRIKVEFQVPEGYVSKVKKGTAFTVKSTSGDMPPAQGEVYFVNSVIDRNTRSSEVKGYLTGPTAGFKPGMFAVIEMVLEVRTGALAVPEGAILIDPRGPHVIAVMEEKGEKVAAFVPVTLGLRSKGLVEIKPVKGEFAEKQLIVAAGVGSLAIFPGAKLEPRPLRAEFQLEPAP